MLRLLFLRLWRRTCRLVLSFTVLLSACVTGEPDNERDRLFTHVHDTMALTEGQRNAISEWRQRPNVLRVEPVRLNFSLRERGKVGDRIVFNPFPEVTIELSLRDVENASGSDYFWRGGDRTITTNAGFAVRGSSVFGTVHYQNRVFQIVPLEKDLHLAVEMDRQALRLY